jgi:hypothetical protein
MTALLAKASFRVLTSYDHMGEGLRTTMVCVCPTHTLPCLADTLHTSVARQQAELSLPPLGSCGTQQAPLPLLLLLLLTT